MKKYKGLIIFVSLILTMILIYVGLFLYCRNYEAKTLLIVLFQLLGFILVLPIFVAVHEAGHMVFGLLSGYSLLTYKVGPFEWYRKDEKVRFRINSLSSMVLGQCLMIPPKPKKKVKPKFFMYNAGGLIFSYLMDIILVALFFLISNIYFKYTLLPMISISMFLTLNNSIYQKGGINDVCNHVVVKNNPKYINSIMFQLEVIANITNGKRYGAKALYEPYFEEKLNHITLPVAQLRFNYAIDKDADIVINENMSDFRRHFRWIREKERLLCQKYDSDINYNYKIYSNIYNHNYEIDEDILKITDSNELASGEKLSIEKMYKILSDKIHFYVENGKSFVVKE